MNDVATLYGFAYTESALDALQSFPAKIRKQILKKIETLAGAPFPPGHKKVVSMSDDAESVLRIRSGDYRVLYVVRNPTIVILDIGHRKDIYR